MHELSFGSLLSAFEKKERRLKKRNEKEEIVPTCPKWHEGKQDERCDFPP